MRAAHSFSVMPSIANCIHPRQLAFCAPLVFNMFRSFRADAPELNGLGFGAADRPGLGASKPSGDDDADTTAGLGSGTPGLGSTGGATAGLGAFTRAGLGSSGGDDEFADGGGGSETPGLGNFTPAGLGFGGNNGGGDTPGPGGFQPASEAKEESEVGLSGATMLSKWCSVNYAVWNTDEAPECRTHDMLPTGAAGSLPLQDICMCGRHSLPTFILLSTTHPARFSSAPDIYLRHPQPAGPLCGLQACLRHVCDGGAGDGRRRRQ